MAIRQIIYKVARADANDPANINLLNDSQNSIADAVDTAGNSTGIALTGTSMPYVGSYGTRDIANQTVIDAAATAAWLTPELLSAFSRTSDIAPTLTVTATGLPSTVSKIEVFADILDSRGDQIPSFGTISANTESLADQDTQLTAGPFVFNNVTANGSGEFVISLARGVDGSGDTENTALNAVLIEYDDALLVTPNTAPDATDDTATTDEDTSVNIDVLANDTDADNDTLSVTAASANNGAVVVESNNTLTYTPNSGFTGSDMITYTVSDGTDTDTGAVTITVNAASSGGGNNGGGGDAPTAPIANPSAQSQLEKITAVGPLHRAIQVANPGLELVGLWFFAQPKNGATPTFDGATGTWQTLSEDTTWDTYAYNGVWSGLGEVSANQGQSSADVGGGSVNTPATGQPAITGTPRVGETLGVDTSGIADDEGLGSFSYVWRRGGNPITGATIATYTPVSADEGEQISVAVSFTDGDGNSEGPLVSNAVTVQAALSSDTTAPTLQIIGAPASVSNNDPFTVTFQFSEAVTGFALNDIGVTNATASSFNAVDADTYTAQILPNGNGNISISVASGAAQDSSSNPSQAASASVTYQAQQQDTQAPVIALNGASIITLNVGDSWTDPGATVTDNVDASAQISADNAPNMNTAETYVLNYNHTDTAGNVATQVQRTVIVQNPAQVPNPTMTQVLTPENLSVDVIGNPSNEVKLYTGLSNRFDVALQVSDQAVDLSVFSRMVLKINEQLEIDSLSQQGIDWSVGNGVVRLDIGQYLSGPGAEDTTLLGYVTGIDRPFVLWHPNLAAKLRIIKVEL